MNANAFANSTSVFPVAPAAPPDAPPSSASKAPPNIADLPESTQELLKRVGASQNPTFQASGAEWEKARREVMQRMTSTSEFSTPLSRARPPADASPSAPGDVASPASRSRGKPGRPKTGRARAARGGTPAKTSRGGGRSGKRKRERDGDGEDSDTGSDVSASYQPTATVTKSGRSIQKPAQFNPAADQMSPSAPSTNKRKRNPQKVGAEGQLCVKCSRGHSPTHNQVVFCDGCNDAWHQWCHEPKIPKDVVEIPDKEWICVNCHDKREMENLPIGNRIGNQVLNLSLDDQKRYLLSLPHKTLVRLLLHSLEATPNLPIFAPNTRDLLRKLDAEEDEDGHVPPPEPDDNDPYPDYSNPAGDPPATYPRPGHGHIPLQPTTDPQFLNRLVDDNFEVYSHSYDDGTGLKPIARTEKEGAWIQRDTGRGASASQALGARINGHSHALSLPGAEPDAEGDEEEADDDGRGDDVDMEPTMFDGAEPDA